MNSPKQDNVLLTLYQEKRLPHALIVLASKETLQQSLQPLLHNIPISPADFLIVETEKTLTVADARTIRHFLTLTRSSSPTRLVAVPDAHRLTTEAANALLKTLEEPPSNTHIILGTDRPEKLLPTIQSRCQFIPLKQEGRFQATTLPNYSLVEYMNHAKELAASDELLENYFHGWLMYLAKGERATNQRAKERLILRYLPLLETNVNRRLLLDNFFLELYNLNQLNPDHSQ